MKKKFKPPFDQETAIAIVRILEDAWNSYDPKIISHAYTLNSEWRNRDEFLTGREAICNFLKRKWKKELNCKLINELWAFTDNRITVRIEYEWRNAETGEWFRTHGNEHLEFDTDGLIKRRDMSANDIPILESQRIYRI